MDMILTIYIVIILVFGLLAVIKNEITYRNRMIISNAIFSYSMAMINAENFVLCVDFSDMEEYETTLWRLWDWGYKNILPKEKYEIIKDYIV